MGALRVTAEHRQVLADALGSLDTEERRDRYRRGDFPRADKVQDLDTRYRWDLVWLAVAIGRHVMTPVLHNGEYTTAHLDSALRQVVKPL